MESATNVRKLEMVINLCFFFFFFFPRKFTIIFYFLITSFMFLSTIEMLIVSSG